MKTVAVAPVFKHLKALCFGALFSKIAQVNPQLSNSIDTKSDVESNGAL